jgi:phosphate-selective porin
VIPAQLWVAQESPFLVFNYNSTIMKKYILFFIMVLFASAMNYNYAQGCMDDGEDDGDAVKIFGFFQPQADYKILDDAGFGGDKNTSNIYFNRARIGVRGNIPYDFSYYFVTELAPKQSTEIGNPNIICDAFITYKRFAPYFKVSVGQFKSQFSAEQIQACHKLLTVNRSQVVDNLAGPIRDMGIMFTGSTDTLLGTNLRDLIGYSVGIMNGTGRNVYDNNVKKDVIARLTIKPLSFLTLGANYRFGAHPAQSETAETDDTRMRYGFDATFDWNNIFVRGEYIYGSNAGSYTTGGGCGGPLEVHEGSVDQAGFYVMAAYMTPWRVQPVIRYETYDPNNATDFDEFPSAKDDIQDIITFGVNYFFNDWTRVQLNYLYKAEESGNVEYPNDEILLQVQVVF